MNRKVLLTLSLIVLLTGCSSKATSSSSVASFMASININNCTYSIIEGEHISISNNINVTNESTNNVCYKSLDESVLSVDSSGNIIGKKEGSTYIRVYIRNHEDIFSDIKVEVNSAKENLNDYNYYTLDMKSGRKHSLCATGKQNILVLPIEIKGFENNATSKELSRINELFNAETNSEWESVKSYYKKSSYGKLDLNFIIPDKWYKSNLGPREIYARKIEDDCGTGTLIEEASSWYKKEYNPSSSMLDKNNDGYIDAIWAVFSAPSTTYYDYETKYTDINPTMFWPLTTSSYLNYQDKGDINSPKSKVYSWASFDFMNRYEKDGTIDAHTFIHETGHMFGLKDYYSYGGGGETPLGCIDMMDCNIGDHNPMSKYALSWTSPKVVTSSKTIELKPFESSGEFILLGDDDYNGTAFDEYFTIDYLTPTGLNKHDYLNPYTGNDLKGYSKEGIRILHVDNRCVDEQGKFTNDPMKFVNDPITNTSYVGYTKFFDSASTRAMFQITLMQKNCFTARRNVLSASNAYYNALVNDKVDANEALFHEGEVFDLSESSSYCSLMPSKSDRLNKYAQGRDKSDVFPYRIEVKELTKEKAIIEITKM